MVNMRKDEFELKLKQLNENWEKLVSQHNSKVQNDNGVFCRYYNPVLTAGHVPVFWRYDLKPETNPQLMTRLGINAVFNAGAIYLNGKYLLVARVEGYDRKSFFAVAESQNGIDNFRFWDYPLILPVNDDPETNVYDMRLTQHEDGWIYGTFCAEYKDKSTPERTDDLSAAVAKCGIARTLDLINWERLSDLQSDFQQRNVVIHPELINGKYGLYTRPLRTFLATGSGDGIGWTLVKDITQAKVEDEEKIFERNCYHSIKEGKNGQGPAPIKTEAGWLHLAHGVRNTAAGMRYVLYAFMTDLNDPSKVVARPGGYLMAPEGDERVGDVSNVLFANGWLKNENDEIFIYYASSDTRLHVATSTVAQLVDYCMNTPEDPLYSYLSVRQRVNLIESNLKLLRNETGR